jgi:hypothetical protein
MMKKLSILILCLMMALSGFSQTGTEKKNNKDTGKLICLPDSVLRKAALVINKYEQDTAIMAHMDDNLFILNEEIRVGDSVITAQNEKLALKDGVIGTWKKKYQEAEANKVAINTDYLAFKKKDKTKMWIAGSMVFLALAGWASSAMK